MLSPPGAASFPAAASAPHGTAAPSPACIPDGFYADAAKRHVESCRNTALNVIDKAIGEVTAALVEPPNEKALGYIMSIQGRDNLSPVEIEAALSVYGGNFAAVKAINSAAVRSGLTIHAATSQLERDYAALNDLRGKVSDFMSYERIACDDDAAHAVSKWVVSDFGEGKGGDVFE